MTGLLTEVEIEDEIERRLYELGDLTEDEYHKEIQQLSVTEDDPFGLHILAPKELEVKVLATIQNEIPKNDPFVIDLQQHQYQISKLDKLVEELHEVKNIVADAISKCDHIPNNITSTEDHNLPVTEGLTVPTSSIQNVLDTGNHVPSESAYALRQEEILKEIEDIREKEQRHKAALLQKSNNNIGIEERVTERLKKEEERLQREKQERIRQRYQKVHRHELMQEDVTEKQEQGQEEEQVVTPNLLAENQQPVNVIPSQVKPDTSSSLADKTPHDKVRLVECGKQQIISWQHRDKESLVEVSCIGDDVVLKWTGMQSHSVFKDDASPLQQIMEQDPPFSFPQQVKLGSKVHSRAVVDLSTIIVPLPRLSSGQAITETLVALNSSEDHLSKIVKLELPSENINKVIMLVRVHCC